MGHRSMVDGFGPGFIPPNSTVLRLRITGDDDDLVKDDPTPYNRSHGLKSELLLMLVGSTPRTKISPQ